MRGVLLLLVCVFACASARTITWTGAAGNSLWGTANNWDANSVPTNADDVTINPVGGSSITIGASATARTVTLGGGNYRQGLTIQASLTVGDFTIKQSGTLTIATNNDAPLAATGTISAQLGSLINWQSGALSGVAVVNQGAALLFSSNALKLLSKANITVFGDATVQPTTIQLTQNSVFNNRGNCTVIGLVTIFATDKPNRVYSNGNFTYQGSSTTNPLTIQVNSTFDSDINIVSGAVIFRDAVTSNGIAKLPQGTTLTVQADPAFAWFRSIQGAGSFTVYSSTQVASLNASWTTLASSGSLTISAPSITKSLSVGGKLVINSGVTFATTDVSVIAGTVTGGGRLTASGNFEIAPTTDGNSNTFISTEVVVAGRGYTTGVDTILFADAGNLHVLSSGTFTISASVTLLKQSGNPVITNEGTFTVNLPVGAVLTSGVDYRGANGNLIFNGGKAVFQSDAVFAGKVSTTNTLIEFRTAEAHLGPVSGTGSINITAAPAATSTFGDVSTSYFGVVNGNVSAGVMTVSTLEIFNGILNLGTSKSHTAPIFNCYGGTLNGNGQISTSTFNLVPSNPVTLRSINISTKQFKLLPTVGSTSVLVENYASITTST